MTKVRESVEWFAGQMEAKLRENDHKGGWDNCDQWYLFQRIDEELDELYGALSNAESENDRQSIIQEAADIANFAMMIADLARKETV